MPKIVDHQQRRRDIAAAAWRVIARHGTLGVTLRSIAEEAGFANGALKPYFPTKDSLLRGTFEYVYEQTNSRVQHVTTDLRGIEALVAFGFEVLPTDPHKQDEARVVIAFWQAASEDPKLIEVNSSAMRLWRHWLTEWIHQAQAAHQISTDIAIEAEVEATLTLLLGAQITAVVDPGHNQPVQLANQFRTILASWGAEPDVLGKLFDQHSAADP